ncbi:hypothetical protein EVAR_96887_1 [Eumeta japonica]|uniref:Uncharacterized protein n=1 Tax=Eumeta variegata TaxID=151549 RepID=A0A4C1WBY5_EUMVA|nr:hypothetical protein EVAR_96887_1 [Eumeta japonica]
MAVFKFSLPVDKVAVRWHLDRAGTVLIKIHMDARPLTTVLLLLQRGGRPRPYKKSSGAVRRRGEVSPRRRFCMLSSLLSYCDGDGADDTTNATGAFLCLHVPPV